MPFIIYGSLYSNQAGKPIDTSTIQRRICRSIQSDDITSHPQTAEVLWIWCSGLTDRYRNLSHIVFYNLLHPVVQMAQVISSRIFPILRRQYKLSGRHELSMQDAFLVKYDATSKGLQRHLSTHIDSSQLSFNIALSSPLPPDPRSAAAAPTEPNFDEKHKNLVGNQINCISF